MNDPSVAQFALDIQKSLRMSPRQIPSLYLYDALGSALFDAICELSWYRVTRAETALLRRQGADILSAAAPLGRIVELGAGDGSKLAALLECRTPGSEPLSLHLIDVSRSALDNAMRAVGQIPGIEVSSHEAAYEDGLAAVSAEPEADGRTLALFLGSNIGNFDPPADINLLQRMRAALRPEDELLLGTDLVKPEAELLLAYDDPLGVTAAFNLNVFARMNRELGANFDLSALKHAAIWNAEASRVEMHVEATREQRVSIPLSEFEFVLEPGERIWTESSYKYRAGDIADLLARAGFKQSKQWVDDDAKFALTLASAH